MNNVFYKPLLENSPQGIALANKARSIIEYNNSFCLLRNEDKDELLSAKVCDIFDKKFASSEQPFVISEKKALFVYASLIDLFLMQLTKTYWRK